MDIVRASQYSFSGKGLFSFFFLRNILVPFLIALVLMYVPYQIVLALMIIGGQAHFLLAYVYQARAKKIDIKYISIALLLFACGVMYFLMSAAAIPLLFAVSILFVTHFAIDELTLHDETWSFAKATTLGGFILFFMTLVTNMVYNTPVLLSAVGSIVVLGVCVRLFFQKPAPSRTEYYLWFLMVLLIAMGLNIIPVAYGAITTFIIILHFFNWMIGYGIKVNARPERRHQYWMDTMLVIALCVALYFIFLFTNSWLFNVFFSVSAYYAWAIAHIVLSFWLSAVERQA